MEINGFYSVRRMIFLGTFFVLFAAAIVAAYGTRMLGPRLDPATPTLSAERGSILDRNGKILAVQTTLYNIAVTRSSIPDKKHFANLLAPVTGISEDEIFSMASSGPGDFFYLKKKISESEKTAVAAAIKQGKLHGIRLEPVLSRTYPENRLASHIIGFLGDDGTGLTGVEYSFQDILSPPSVSPAEVQDGYNVMLTIDATLQYELEKIGKETMENTDAEAVLMLAANARSGEILAYISEPAANLNQYSQSTQSQRLDRPALYAFEPGSVFKIFTIAAALDLGVIQDSDLFLCDGGYSLTTPRGEQIQIKCLHQHGWLTAREVIKLSCNDGTGQIVEKIPDDVFESKLRQFGFGSKTGIELPGETNGIFNRSTYWSLRSKPTIAIGQEISVSALQMVEAATAFANKGETIKLTLLSKLYSRDGTLIYSHQRKPITPVLSPEAASLMLSYMQTTSETGTGTRASVGDVPMAVKTGTAQMRNSGGTGYSDTDFISSCIGIFPADDPEIILYLAIVKPVGETYGGRIAAPVVSKAANVLIDSLGFGRGKATSVTHTGLIRIPKNKPVVLGDIVPDFSGVPKKMLTPLFERSDIIVRISGDGYVVGQSPEAGTPFEKGMTIDLVLE